MIDLSASENPVLALPNGFVLRPLKEGDIGQRYIDGMNAPSVRKYIVSGARAPHTAESVGKFVRENWLDPNALLFGIFLERRHCGNVRLHDIADRSAYIGIAIFDLEMQGRGLGSAAIAAVAGYAFGSLGVGEVMAGIDPENAASIRAFSRAGFTDSGELRQGCQIWRLSAAGL